MDIREVLSGGDLRSVGHVDAVVAYVGNDPDRFSELMTDLSAVHPQHRDELKALLESQLEAGSPAVKSRSKKLLQKL